MFLRRSSRKVLKIAFVAEPLDMQITRIRADISHKLVAQTKRILHFTT